MELGIIKTFFLIGSHGWFVLVHVADLIFWDHDFGIILVAVVVFDPSDGFHFVCFSREAEGHSIYVRNLSQNATPSQLEDVFSKFGPIKQGGVQVRSNKVFFYSTSVKGW